MKQKYTLNNKNAEYAAFGKKLHRCAERTKIARRRRDGGRLYRAANKIQRSVPG
jgi:hypothetical protein